MTSGYFTRHPCPGCGRKTLTPMVSVGVTEFYGITASRCRSCKCAFARGKLVQGPDRSVTDEILDNRAAVLVADADDIESLARGRLQTAADMREAAQQIRLRAMTPDDHPHRKKR